MSRAVRGWRAELEDIRCLLRASGRLSCPVQMRLALRTLGLRRRLRFRRVDCGCPRPPLAGSLSFSSDYKRLGSPLKQSMR